MKIRELLRQLLAPQGQDGEDEEAAAREASPGVPNPLRRAAPRGTVAAPAETGPIVDLLRELLAPGRTPEDLERRAEIFARIGKERPALERVTSRIATAWRLRAAERRAREAAFDERADDVAALLEICRVAFSRHAGGRALIRILADTIVVLSARHPQGRVDLVLLAEQLVSAAAKLPGPPREALS